MICDFSNLPAALFNVLILCIVLLFSWKLVINKQNELYFSEVVHIKTFDNGLFISCVMNIIGESTESSI